MGTAGVLWGDQDWDESGLASLLCSFENAKGVKGIVVPTCLPEKVMEKFLEELDYMTHAVPNE